MVFQIWIDTLRNRSFPTSDPLQHASAINYLNTTKISIDSKMPFLSNTPWWVSKASNHQRPLSTNRPGRNSWGRYHLSSEFSGVSWCCRNYCGLDIVLWCVYIVQFLFSLLWHLVMASVRNTNKLPKFLSIASRILTRMWNFIEKFILLVCFLVLCVFYFKSNSPFFILF